MQIKSACRSAPAGFFYILKFVMILVAGHGIMNLWKKMGKCGDRICEFGEV